jgi:hypothetical protein
VLALSAGKSRILISHDVNTLPKQFGHGWRTVTTRAACS